MDAEIKEAFLKMIETGTEITPDVMHDLLLWANIRPFISVFFVFLFLFLVIIFFKKFNDLKCDSDLKDFMFVSSVLSSVCFLISCTFFISSCIYAIKAHYTPYAYLIDLIK